MSERRLRILIVGGYGVFGGRLVQLLADQPRLTLLVAGRSKAQAQVFCAGMPAKATLIAETFDRAGDVETQLRTLAPDIVVDASGPFQGYGDNPYALVKAALAHKIHYLDLADGSDFVAGVAQFDASAKEQDVFVLSGVSSFPVLTAAVCRRLAQGLARVDTITCGIAPSPYAGVGLNVIRAISSYAGKPLKLVRGGVPSVGYGLTETRRATIAPPGRLPLKSTLFSLVDVPDLVVLPQQWPGLQSAWMGAGPVPAILHRALIALATLVRFKLLPSLSFLAPLFHRAINTLRWGEHRGGMFVALEGATADGGNVARSWHLLAEGDDGPLIPSMAVAAIVQKCLAGAVPLSGARSAVADLELADYDALFARRTIFTGFRDDIPSADAPLYRRLLGSAFDALPAPIRAMHDGAREAAGSADVERGTNLPARLIANLFGFPPAGRNVPLTVSFTSDAHGETWTRTFGTGAFSSHQSLGTRRNDKLLVERFGPFSFAMAVVSDREKLCLIVRRWSLLGVPMPLALAPTGDAFEHAADGRFNFHVEIRLPLIGRIVRYRGSLAPTL
jgi:Domain of unknown function (DUF4166)/Saccharopine dehydrogenase NADP binding domain